MASTYFIPAVPYTKAYLTAKNKSNSSKTETRINKISD